MGNPTLPLDTAALVALASACGFSLHAHVPVNAVQARFPKHLRGEIPKALDRLRRAEKCQKHPTRGGITWELTRDGLQDAQSIVAGRALESTTRTDGLLGS